MKSFGYTYTLAIFLFFFFLFGLVPLSVSLSSLPNSGKRERGLRGEWNFLNNKEKNQKSRCGFYNQLKKKTKTTLVSTLSLPEKRKKSEKKKKQFFFFKVIKAKQTKTWKEWERKGQRLKGGRGGLFSLWIGLKEMGVFFAFSLWIFPWKRTKKDKNNERIYTNKVHFCSRKVSLEVNLKKKDKKKKKKKKTLHQTFLWKLTMGVPPLPPLYPSSIFPSPSFPIHPSIVYIWMYVCMMINSAFSLE